MIFVLAVTLAMGYYKEMVIFGVGLTLLNLILIAKHDLDIFGVTLKISMDTVSLSLVNLTLIISMLMILSSMNLVLFKKFERYFLMVVITLTLILTFTFMVINIFWFYILFEASLVPTFILILGWGYQPERAQAGVYMLLYTIFASLPLLVSILVWKNSLGTLSFILTPPMKLYFLSEKMWILVSMLAFVVKLPLYMTHLWLPKAHVEAPVAGSMILAAILLKLGGYGLMRLSCVTQYLVFAFGPYIMGFTLVGGIYVGLTCIFQTDIKVLIALSSVAHMALVMAGIMSLSSAGMNSSFLIMVSHGFSSSALFSIANMTYERIGSRSLFYSKGVGLVLPSLLFCWFMLCLTNMSAPPSLNLFSEMISAIAIISWSFLSFAPLIMLIFMSAAYSLFLYSSSQHGKFQIATKIFNSSSLREHLILFMHWLPLNVLILAPSFLAPCL